MDKSSSNKLFPLKALAISSTLAFPLIALPVWLAIAGVVGTSEYNNSSPAPGDWQNFWIGVTIALVYLILITLLWAIYLHKHNKLLGK